MLGQVSLTHKEYKDLQLRTTIVPFIALGVGAGVGYLYFKPKIDLMMRILDVLQRVFPFLNSSSGQVAGFKKYPFMKQAMYRMPRVAPRVAPPRAVPPVVAKNANDVAVADGANKQFGWWVADGGVPPIGEVFVPDSDFNYLPTIKVQSGFYKYEVANSIIDSL